MPSAAFREHLLPEGKQSGPVSTLQLFRLTSSSERLLVTFGTVLAIASGVAKPAFAGILGHVSQSFINFTNEIAQLNATDPRREEIFEEFHHQVAFLCLLYLLLAIGTFFCATIQDMCFITAGENMVNRLRKVFMEAVLHQDIGWFDSQKTGVLSSSLFSNIDRIKDGTGNYFGMTIQTLSMFVGGYGICFYYDWKLALIGTCLTPFMGLWGYWNSSKMSSLAKEQEEKNSEAGGIAQQALTSMKTVMYFNGQEGECKRYKSALEHIKVRGVGYARWNGSLMAVSVFLLHASYCITIWTGTTLVYNSAMSPGVVITVFITIMLCIGQLHTVAPLLTKISRAKVAAEALYNVIDRDPEIDSRSKCGERPEGEGVIQIENVHFRYPTRMDVPVLKGISFDVQPGQTVALVGASGSGKSTIVQLLLRFYDSTAGRISIDGVAIEDWNIAHLRRTIGVVSQEPKLFDTTIEENVSFGRQNVSENEIWKALKRANALEFVKTFPKGLQTVVGDRGAQLSGGQKQRIAIARALVRDPKILLLDEATSALDAQSEAIVQQALENAAKGRTTVVIAHRLSTIRNADKIIAMKDGEIVETGTHDHLMALEGRYYDLVKSQVFVEAEEAGPKPVQRFSRSISSDVNPREFLRMLSPVPDTIPEEETLIVEDVALKRLTNELSGEGATEASVWRIFKETGSDWKLFFVAVLMACAQGVIYPAFSFGFTEIIKIFSGHQKEEMLQMGHLFALFFLGIGVYYGITEFLQVSLFGTVAERLAFSLRQKVYTNLMRQDATYYDKPNHAPGRLLTRLATDANNIKPAVNGRLGLTLVLCTTDVIAYSLAVYFGWQMALVAIPVFSPVYIAFAFKSKFLRKKILQDEKEMEACGKVAMEAMENIRTVQALTLEAKMHQNYCFHLQKPIRNGRQRALVQGLAYGLTNAVHFFMYSICFRAGLYLIYHNYLEPHAMLRSMFMVTFTSFSLGGISAYAPEYIKAKMAAGLLFQMADEEPSIDGLCENGTRPSIQGSIKIKNVRFRYPQRGDVEVIKGLNLDVQRGQTVALVGGSGCGKSTVTSLLERMYDPEEGTIEIDGCNIAAINSKYLRSQISIVSQEPVLFDMSIKKNILYGLKEGSVSHQQMVEAAKKANIHDFVSCLPDAYGTRVGDKGTALSGGQKQRIAIARALVREPKILILDEATSALDTESEKHVQKALEQATTGRTCLVVAHRLSTIRNADQIVVFSDGRIAERGTHDELIKRKAVYFGLVQKQSTELLKSET